MKIRIACCDDEKQQLELYKTMFTNIEMRQDIKLNVEYFLSGNFMLERFQSEKNPFDLVYLDMDMDEKSGLDLAKEIRQNYHSDCLILFLTNYPKYMQNSFDVRAFQLNRFNLMSLKESLMQLENTWKKMIKIV